MTSPFPIYAETIKTYQMFCSASFLHRFIGIKGSMASGVLETSRKGNLSSCPAFSVAIKPTNIHPWPPTTRLPLTGILEKT